MATRKFRKNSKSFTDLFGTTEKIAQYFMEQQLFENVTETKNSNLIAYDVKYNKDKNRIYVNVANNEVFSYLDTEEELKNKMNKYIQSEEYENAQIMLDYFNVINLKYNI